MLYMMSLRLAFVSIKLPSSAWLSLPWQHRKVDSNQEIDETSVQDYHRQCHGTNQLLKLCRCALCL